MRLACRQGEGTGTAGKARHAMACCGRIHLAIGNAVAVDLRHQRVTRFASMPELAKGQGSR
jgi:hypothetical protein